jgi:Tfp pilus assembly protein PilZ
MEEGMREGTGIQRLMPLMREFGALERRRLGEGVTPLEYQRWLDLKSRIGRRFARSREAGLSALGGGSGRPRPSRLLVRYRSRDHLIDSILSNVRPAGFFVPTPFAAEVGTEFLVRITLEQEGDSADVPAVVVTSITQGAHTLSTLSMGMGLKILKPGRGEAAGISKLFDALLDERLGLHP